VLTSEAYARPVRLWLLRHAKSSWSDAGLADEDRPLAPRGEHAAERMSGYIVAQGIAPELVLCSSALRARQTFASVLPALGTQLEIRVEPALYTFDADVLLDRLRRIPSEVTSVMLVGHNPAMQDLALRLAGSGDALHHLAQKYPTAALAEIAFPKGAWNSLADRQGELVRFTVPRELEDS
jgi:phosphohistidine phosphatase